MTFRASIKVIREYFYKKKGEKMIQPLSLNSVNRNFNVPQKSANIQKQEAPVSEPSFKGNYSATGLVNAYQSLHGIQTAKTVSFGKSLSSAFEDMRYPMQTCINPITKRGEDVGYKVESYHIIKDFAGELPHDDDAVKTTIVVNGKKEEGQTFTEARTQIKRTGDTFLYQMAVRQPRKYGENIDVTKPLSQDVKINQDPKIREKSYVLNTKGKLMAVVEDQNNVILTNSGKFEKKSKVPGERLSVEAMTPGIDFTPFTPGVQEVKPRTEKESIGKGTEIVIGMEDGRFVPEIIDSINTFVDKVDKGEIVLDQFVAAPNAENIQLTMLAGGFGSRAEYTNASSDGIFHGKENGAQSTKGVFRTATGLTPMETTFVSLHKAGLLDCSKGNLKAGKDGNIKFYLNQSGVNKGNGGFTVDLYNKMEREGRESLMIFPNDSMSRLSGACEKAAKIMNSGEAAVAMIAKKVSAKDAEGTFGIMKLDENNQILEFAEKPSPIPEGYADEENMCLTNTFQFAVSKEAFHALATLEPEFPEGKGKEPRDWSKTYIPIIMQLSQNGDDIEKMAAGIEKVV